MEKTIKLSFFKRVKMSIFDFDKYHLIASEGLGRAILYLLKLMLLFSLILTSAFLIKFTTLLNQGISYIKNETPNFYFSDTSFYIESDEDVVLENHQYVDIQIVLSNKETYDENQITNFDGTVLVLLKNKALFKQQNSTSIISQNYEEINKNIEINNLNKEKILSIINKENGYTIYANIFVVVFIIVFLMYFTSIILDTILLSILGYIVSRMIRLYLKYAPIYSISISAITLAVALNLIYMIINLFTGFVIPYFQIMYTLISYICLVAALLIMKSEIIKKKVEIQIEIMNKAKEGENKEREEKKKDDQKEDKKENEKENKKDELKDKVNGKINKNKDKPEPQANIK